MDFFKINEDRFHEISSNRTPAATRLFLAMTSHANRATQQHLIPHITATQTAIADLARMSQATVSKALKELQAADLVRLQAVNGVPVYQISPFHVWKGANELHRKAQIEWQRSALKQVSA